jgi:predicted secreted Zn-dependent protease
MAQQIGKESTKTYAISGTTPLALYQSIGAKGPLVGTRRVIAHTTFDLKWGRDYVKNGAGCRLTRAQPFLSVTYTLPRPASNLSGDVARRWQRFIEGIEAHEFQHGVFVQQMTTEIRDGTAVLTTDQDNANCDALRQKVQGVVAQAFNRYKARNREFEVSEMSQGGNVHQLVLALLEG